MQSIKILALLISIVSFQSLQATSSSTSQENSVIASSDSVSTPKSEGLWGYLKQTISSWMPSFKTPSTPQERSKRWDISETIDPEYKQLVDLVVRKSMEHTKSVLEDLENLQDEYYGLYYSSKGQIKQDKAFVKKLAREEDIEFVRSPEGDMIIATPDGSIMIQHEDLMSNSDKLFIKIKVQDKPYQYFLIKTEDGYQIKKPEQTKLSKLLYSLAKTAESYATLYLAGQGPQYFERYKNTMTRFYDRVKKEKLDKHFFDGGFFEDGFLLTKSLSQISSLQRKPAALKKHIKNLFLELDGGELSDSSREDLTSVNILTQKSSSWFPKIARHAMLPLLATSSAIMFVSNMVPVAAAARPTLLDNFCSTSEFSYGYCESAFATPIGFESQIASIKSNTFFQDIISNTIIKPSRSLAILDTLADLSNMNSQFYGEIITSRTGSFSGGNVTSTTYFDVPPHLGMQDFPISSTQYQRIAFNMTNTADSSRQTTNSYIRTGPINRSYFGQIEDSERMILALTPVNETSFVYGVMVDRPFGGTPTVVREGIMTSNVLPMSPSGLTPTLMNNINPNGLLPVESVDSLISSRFYSGNVAGTDGANPRPISQYLEDIGFSTTNDFSDVKNCLESPGVSSLACTYQFAKYPGFTTSLYVYSTQPNSVVTLSRNLLQGQNYTEGTYQANSGNVAETLMSYTWNPSLSTATRTNSTLSMPFSTLRGTLPLGQIEKIWIYNPDPANSELGYVVRTTQNSSGTSTSYYVVPGEGITTFPSNPSTPIGPTPTGSVPVPTPDSPQEPGTPSSPSGMSTTTIIAIAVPIGVVLLTGGVLATVFGLKKHKENKKSKLENEDLENGNGRRATSSTALIAMAPENSPQRGITREGLAPTQRGMFSGTTVDGKLNGKRYGIYFKVTEDEFDDILAKTGLKKVFTPAGSKMDLVLGGGNFGQVRVAKDLDTDELVAVKIVPGTEKVTSSLREGNLQTRLRTQPFVMPLDDRTHYDPKAPKDASPEEIQSAKIASSESLKVLKKAYGPVEMQKLLDKEKKYLKRVTGTDDQQGIELLLQASPLASLGNGEDLSYYLSFLDGIDDDLKSKIIVYVSYHVMKGLLGFHDFGMSHLDLKAANILSSWKSILIQRTKKGPPSKENVWVSDVGCTAQNTTITGGNGDVSYFPPERSQHVCYFLQTLRKKEKVNPNYSYANFNGFAADNFAAGLTILELIMNQHPLQDLFDTLPEGGVREYMLEEWTPEICTKTLEAVFAKFEDTDNDIFKIIRGLTYADPKLRWSTKTALEALEKLLPKEDGDKLFSQLEQKLQESQKVKTPEVGMDLVHEYRPSNRQYLQGEQEKLNYQVLPTGKPNLGDVYGAKDPNFKELLAIYGDQPHYTDFPKEVDEEEVTYTDFAQVATSSNPPPRTPKKWVYKDENDQ